MQTGQVYGISKELNALRPVVDSLNSLGKIFASAGTFRSSREPFTFIFHFKKQNKKLDRKKVGVKCSTNLFMEKEKDSETCVQIIVNLWPQHVQLQV